MALCNFSTVCKVTNEIRFVKYQQMSCQRLPGAFHGGFQGEWKPQPLVLSLTNECGQALSWLGEFEGGGGFNHKLNYIWVKFTFRSPVHILFEEA